LFAGNSAYHGGAFYSHVSLTITNSTFAGNSAGHSGGSIYFRAGSTNKISNTILYGSSAPQAAEICLGDVSIPKALLTLDYTDIGGGQAGILINEGILTWGAGNLNLVPQFTDPDGPDNNPATFNDNDYSLSIGSPCVDAGRNGALTPDLLDVDGDGDTTELVPLDLFHQLRRIDVLSVPDTGAGSAPIVDMGALERQG
jgi:predicted outer membrane repeat protein